MIWHYLIWEWKRVLKSPILCLTVLLFPLLILSVVGLIIYHTAQSEIDDVELVVIDEDDTFETNALIEQLASDDSLNDYITFQKETGAVESYLNNENVAAVLHVPEGFTEQLRQGHNQPINVHLNQGQPFSSRLAQLLLESGEDYITAAQSGVNTVLHFSDVHDRQVLIQDMTLHFTWLTLGRNQLFDEQYLSDHSVLSWQEQGYIAMKASVLLMMFLFFVLVFRPRHFQIVQNRFRLLGFTSFKQGISQALFYSSFMFLYIVVLVGITTLRMDFNPIYVSIQWLLIMMIMVFIYLIVEKIWRTATVVLMLSASFNIILLVMSGVLLPAAYLPSYLRVEGLQIVQHSFYTLFNSHDVPFKEWSLLLGLVVGLVIVLWLLTYKRGERL
ncbi:ABC transporter permease [Alkalibacillus sp. S2W]|uniref:ABC transporter permease n=1 Tax=Alkalibacillus sp. S2W TaxID=3386553 RepID=UPI00398D0D88